MAKKLSKYVNPIGVGSKIPDPDILSGQVCQILKCGHDKVTKLRIDGVIRARRDKNGYFRYSFQDTVKQMHRMAAEARVNREVDRLASLPEVDRGTRK